MPMIVTPALPYIPSDRTHSEASASDPVAQPFQPVFTVTIWNEDAEGNRVGEPARMQALSPDGERLYVTAPPQIQEEAMRYHYRTCYRYDREDA